MDKFKLRYFRTFAKKYVKLIKNNEYLEDKIKTKLKILSKNPFDASLSTHKVKSKSSGLVYSSRITGDVRILWNYIPKTNQILIILDIGGHEGKKKVY